MRRSKVEAKIVEERRNKMKRSLEVLGTGLSLILMIVMYPFLLIVAFIGYSIGEER